VPGLDANGEDYHSRRPEWLRCCGSLLEAVANGIRADVPSREGLVTVYLVRRCRGSCSRGGRSSGSR
jgi:hypothetical protein